ncbi:hypothetical protein F2Q70_00026057 [Brassica cretica]|uniref:Uncharacterized protein n=1 Tax=Brassica cretica TaxID=69181 RepID=A0A8S9L9A1_BRACR|nr:hypothetical protein F2Q70_00026057 [Brassica cretica]
MYPCKTMEDVLSRAWAQVKWEEDVASRAKAQPKQDQRSARSNRGDLDERSSQKGSKNSGSRNRGRFQYRPQEKEEVGQQVKWPPKMKAHDSFRNPELWCDFHRDHGHKTEDCIALRIEVNELLQKGAPDIDRHRQSEAGKSSLTELINEEVVQTEPIGQLSNETSQTKQGTEIPVKINPTLIKGEEIKLPLEDYLDLGRTYSNRSAIKIPGDDTKKSRFNADYYCMNQHRSDIAHIEEDALSDMENQLEEETSYSDPYSVFNIDSFTQTYDIAVKSRTGKEKFNIIQPLTGNQSQVAEIATAIKRETGRLPGSTDLNPRRQVSAAMLRSGKRLATNTKNNTGIGNSANADETGKSNSQPILLHDPDPKRSRENGKSTAENNKEKTIDLEVGDDSEIEAEIDRQYGTQVNRPVEPVVDQHSNNPIDRRRSSAWITEQTITCN